MAKYLVVLGAESASDLNPGCGLISIGVLESERALPPLLDAILCYKADALPFARLLDELDGGKRALAMKPPFTPIEALTVKNEGDREPKVRFDCSPVERIEILDRAKEIAQELMRNSKAASKVAECDPLSDPIHRFEVAYQRLLALPGLTEQYSRCAEIALELVLRE